MKNYLYMVLAALCLAPIGVLVKLIGSEIHFMTLMFYRVFLGFIFLLTTVPLIDKKAFRVSKKDAKNYFVVGLILAVGASLFVTANLFAPVQNVVLINRVSPFFVLLFASVLLKERITKTKIITLIIAFIGLAIISPLQFGAHYIGNLLALGSAFFVALLITEMRKEDKTHSIGDVIWFFFFATLLLSPFPFVFGIGNLSKVLVYVLILGVVSTGIAYLFYNLALEKIEAEEASIISTIITPLFSIQLAILIINEPIYVQTILGGTILVIAGVYLETHRKKLKSVLIEQSFKGK